MPDDPEGGIARIPPNSTAIWLCHDHTDVPKQSSQWCVPSCMAMLSQRLFGVQRGVDWFALQWQQPPDEPIDRYYESFRAFCLANGMDLLVDWTPEGTRVMWDWLARLRRPILIATVSHAQLCIGACAEAEFDGAPARAYRVLDPAHPRRNQDWRTFPSQGLRLRFAFGAPGNACAERIPIDRPESDR